MYLIFDVAELNERQRCLESGQQSLNIVDQAHLVRHHVTLFIGTNKEKNRTKGRYLNEHSQ